ncbi:hypothetical protein PIB30_075423 [Stylosanthes scabra]|uniref:Uncharacterized protein n=1 Tax=Stylosanthes scabra TaxID=79078 RepID=A0ABU6YSK9_9FABA|nr:hypothetical protein [Stylosanthes scabra]
MGFDALSHLPNKNLNQRLLKHLFDRYDIYDNTIYSDAAAVKITTKKIGDALGLSSNVVRKKLNPEDQETHKFFQGKTTVALQNLIKSTPLDTNDNRKLFMRSFICFIQKVFLLPNSTTNITPTALPTIFDLETIRSKNWELHMHNFLLQELKKAKQNKTVAIHGCVYVVMNIYFHETHFGENSKEVEAQASWLAYWTGESLKNRMKQEKKHEAGLLKTGEMRAKKDKLEKKRTKRDTKSDSESYQSSSTDSESESSSSSDSDADSGHDVHEEQPPQQEIRSKRRNDRAVVGSNEPLNITQHSVTVPEFSQLEDTPLDVAFENIKKRKKQQRGDRITKQRLSHINEGDEMIKEAGRSASEIRMFDSFDTVSLRRDDSDNVAVEGSVVLPSQPSQKEKSK